METTRFSSRGSRDGSAPSIFSLDSPCSVRREDFFPLLLICLGSGRVIRPDRCSLSSNTLQLMFLRPPSGLNQDHARQISREICSRVAEGSEAMIWRISSMSSRVRDRPQIESGKSARMIPPGSQAILPEDFIRNVPRQKLLQIRRGTIVPGAGIQIILEIRLDIEIVPGRRLQGRHGGCQQFAAPLGASAIVILASQGGRS